MAIIKRGRGESLSAEFDPKTGLTTQKYQHPLIVELEASDPDPISAPEVLALPGMPIPGRTIYSPRPGVVVPFAVCKRLVPTHDPKSRRLWYIKADYEISGPDQQEPEDEETDPISLAPRIEFFTDSIEVPMLRDYDGTLIVDPLGDLFETPTMAPIALAGVRITRYVDTFDEETLAGWKFSTNNAEWRSKPIDAWTITDVTGTDVQFGAVTVGQLVFTIVSHPLELTIGGAEVRVGWRDTRALWSFEYLEAGKRKTNRNADGTPTRVWIDKDTGARIAGGFPTNQSFAVFRNRKQKDFSLIA